jgi:hypothetical protein
MCIYYKESLPTLTKECETEAGVPTVFTVSYMWVTHPEEEIAILPW